MTASQPKIQNDNAVATYNAVKIYGKIGSESAVTALNGVSLEVPLGQFLAVMGPSGSGKSTLLHCMAGLDDLTSGNVIIGSTNLNGLSDRQLTRLRRNSIGFMFQSFNLLPTLTAEQNIRLPSDLAGSSVDEKWFNTLIDLLGIGDRLKHRPSELSGGQQQRVAAARALLSKPTVVFADEPTGNLDSKAGALLLGFLRSSVHEHGQTIVMVTHDPNAASFADKAVLLADGQIIHSIESPTQKSVLEALETLGA